MVKIETITAPGTHPHSKIPSKPHCLVFRTTGDQVSEHCRSPYAFGPKFTVMYPCRLRKTYIHVCVIIVTVCINLHHTCAKYFSSIVYNNCSVTVTWQYYACIHSTLIKFTKLMEIKKGNLQSRLLYFFNVEDCT